MNEELLEAYRLLSVSYGAETMELPKERACRACGLIKLLGDFSPQADGRYGRRTQCKACRAVAARKTRRVFTDRSLFLEEQRLLLPKGLKRCSPNSGCGLVLPVSDFASGRKSPAGPTFSHICRRCHSAWQLGRAPATKLRLHLRLNKTLRSDGRFRCSKCERQLPLAMKLGGYANLCRCCNAARNVARRENDPAAWRADRKEKYRRRVEAKTREGIQQLTQLFNEKKSS